LRLWRFVFCVVFLSDVFVFSVLTSDLTAPLCGVVVFVGDFCARLVVEPFSPFLD